MKNNNLEKFNSKLNSLCEEFNVDIYCILAKEKTKDFKGDKMIALHPDKELAKIVLGAMMHDCPEVNDYFNDAIEMKKIMDKELGDIKGKTKNILIINLYSFLILSYLYLYINSS